MSLPSEQQVLTLFQGTVQQQYTMKRLIQHFAVAVEERPAFREAIRAMVARGRLVLLHGTRYALPQRLDTLAGVVKRHADGYGFVVLEDEQEDNIYLPRRAMQGVMHGDRVLARLETPPRHGARRSGRVVQVLERGPQEVIGRGEMLGKACWLLPLDARVCPDIFIPPPERLQARHGAMAVAEITRYALTQEHPHGGIVEVLGNADAPDMEMRLILRKNGLSTLNVSVWWGSTRAKPTAWATACACGWTISVWRVNRSILPYLPHGDAPRYAMGGHLRAFR